MRLSKREAQLEQTGPTREQMAKARNAIMRKDQVCFDVAAENGQMFGNVKHLKWFVEAVAEEFNP